eukprot:12816772-Alexandrium_andersonii.AAC.1
MRVGCGNGGIEVNVHPAARCRVVRVRGPIQTPRAEPECGANTQVSYLQRAWGQLPGGRAPVSYTHLRAHETSAHL